MKRVGIALVATMVFATAACGEGGTDAVSSAPGITSAGYSIDEVESVSATATAALDQFGDLPTAGVAILTAYDSGYSFDQIVAGIDAGTLSSSGVIEGVAPELAFGGSPGLLAAPAGFLAEIDKDLVRQMLAGDSPDERGFAMLTLILWGISRQVPVGEIIEAIVLGEFSDAAEAVIERVDTEEASDRRVRDEMSAYSNCLSISMIPGQPPIEDCYARVRATFAESEDASAQETTTAPPTTGPATTEPSTTIAPTTTITALRAEGVFNMPVTDEVTIIANSVALLIVDTEVTFDAFDWAWSYPHPAPASCIKTADMRFLDSDVTFDPAARSFQGTVTANDKSDDEGAACPFGGGHRDVDRVGEVAGTLENGIVTMTISFPTIPEAFETILPLAAQVS